MQNARWAKIRGLAKGFAVLTLVLVVSAAAFAQDKKKTDDKPKPPPAPEDHVVETDDGVELHYTFYPSSKGKTAVPIILVHGLESRRAELAPLAKLLQEAGHAVMVPDLRGHGASNVRKLPQRPQETLTPANLKAGDFALMSTTDFLLLKRDLLERNNAGELNIDLLTLVGVDIGSIVAMNWAALDWSQPDLPTIRIGHDVKALVLVSPLPNYKNLKMAPALSNAAVSRQLSLMILGGANDAKTNTELKRLDNALARFHPAPKQESGESDEDFAKRSRKQQNFYVMYEATTLQGAKLINAPKPLNVPAKIAAFVDLRLVEQAEDKDLPPWDGERRTKESMPR